MTVKKEVLTNATFYYCFLDAIASLAPTPVDRFVTHTLRLSKFKIVLTWSVGKSRLGPKLKCFNGAIVSNY